MKTLPAFALAATLTVACCAQYASVSETKAQFRPARASVGALASVSGFFVGRSREEILLTLSCYLANPLFHRSMPRVVMLMSIARFTTFSVRARLAPGGS
jgi:hypothetical protein